MASFSAAPYFGAVLPLGHRIRRPHSLPEQALLRLPRSIAGPGSSLVEGGSLGAEVQVRLADRAGVTLQAVLREDRRDLLIEPLHGKRVAGLGCWLGGRIGDRTDAFANLDTREESPCPPAM